MKGNRLRTEINKLKFTHLRFSNLLEVTEETCNTIMKELSNPQFEERLSEVVKKKYQEY